MKKLFILMMLAICTGIHAQASAQADTALTKKVDELAKTVAQVKQKTESQAESLAKGAAAAVTDRHLSAQQKLMVLSPILLSLVFMLYCVIRLRQEGFKLSDALAGDNPVERQIENPKYDPANVAAAPALITVVDYPKSSSRLVAFFSGLCAITISVSTVSNFFYMYFRSGQVPDFDKLYTIVLTLGIGVTPYAFNKISKAINPAAAG